MNFDIIGRYESHHFKKEEFGKQQAENSASNQNLEQNRKPTIFL